MGFLDWFFPRPSPLKPPAPVSAWSWVDPETGSGWTGQQVQNTGSSVGYVDGVMMCKAGARTSAGKVGKAGYIKAFPAPAKRGQKVLTRFSLTLDDGIDGLTIWDMECKNCGVSTQPGLRLNIDEGLLRFERSKLDSTGKKFKPIYQSDSTPLLPGRPVVLTIEVTLGGETDGRIKLFRDGQIIVDKIGTTMPLKLNAAGALTAEQVDRVQVGLTSNFGPKPASLRIDGFSVSVV